MFKQVYSLFRFHVLTTTGRGRYALILLLLLPWAILSGLESCRETTTPCSLATPDGACDSGSHCEYGQCQPDRENACSSQYPVGVCPYPDETCLSGTCHSVFDDACSLANPYGVCPDQAMCQAGVCQPATDLDLAGGLAPAKGTRQAIYYEFAKFYEEYFVFPDRRDIDWLNLFNEFYLKAVSRPYYREFYRQLSNYVARLRDNHSTLQSSVLCDSQFDTLTPTITYNSSPLGACGRVIDGKYVIYGVDAGAPLKLSVGDAIVRLGQNTGMDSLFSRWQEEARCQDNSFQYQHHAYLAFQTSMLNMAPWYDSITVEHKDGTLEDIPMKGLEPYYTYCFGFPLRYDTQLGMDVYTEELTPTVRYFHTLSFMNPPVRYRDAFKGMAGKDGIIIDLRGNSGGFMKSCGALLAPFIESPYNFGRCWDNTSSFDQAEDTVIEPDPIDGFTGKIAILVNEISKSAADFCVYGFQHADVIGDVRVFGEPMAGLYSTTTTGSFSYTLNDVSETLNMGVTLSQCRTADGENLDGYFITPDEIIDFSAADINNQNDPVIKKALDWIGQ
jgi:hypothetical protein